MDKVEALRAEIAVLDDLISQAEGQLEQVNENMARLRIVKEVLESGLPDDPQLELDLSLAN